mmetsp:Transcript_39113/g.84779  ORF Transcript_39113/g.84779 Transcript_39113/m.84779 type:complete len:219 (+) Transcript_39113:13-669(+)
MAEVAELTSRLFQVHRTVCQMLKDRGYEVFPSEVATISAADFKQKLGMDLSSRASLMMHAYKAGNKPEGSPDVLVFWANEDKLGAGGVSELFQMIDSKGVKLAILVVQKTMTPWARRAVPEECKKRIATGQPVDVHIFYETELVVNITKHCLVPRHVVMSNKEKARLLSKYHVTEAKLPRILITDPVARYYGLRRGQCVKIIRDSETAGRYTSYRICV